MAALTHVCMWDDKGWKNITAEEAARLHPGGTVSAHSGLFMCELCGQYVTLTDTGAKIRHFRHSSSEKSKNCPERTYGAAASMDYSATDHQLPIKVINITEKNFELQMGFVKIPSELMSPELRIEIRPDPYSDGSFVFLRERLNDEGITYLSIGSIPYARYKINVLGKKNDSIYNFWPEYINGIDPEGTIFDASSGKKLVYDSDVQVGKKYYLMKKGILNNISRTHVSCKEISRRSAALKSWRLYEIVANDYDRESARFFLEYHCRLTENPVQIQTVWPVYIESPYVIKHSQRNMFMHISGNAPVMRTFPDSYLRTFPSGESIVLEMSCNSRQQLISAGRTNALQYTYFWKETLNKITERPEINVLDLKGVSVSDGKQNSIPYKGILRINAEYDGVITIRHNDNLIDKIKLNANTPIEIDHITWNMEINICIGLDSIWKACFVHETAVDDSIDEIKVLKKLESYSGKQMPISHSLANVALQLTGYPKIRNWLYKCIRTGYINEKAYRYLQSWIIFTITKIY